MQKPTAKEKEAEEAESEISLTDKVVNPSQNVLERDDTLTGCSSRTGSLMCSR